MDEYPCLIITPDLSSIYTQVTEQGMVLNLVYSLEELKDFLLKYQGVVTDTPVVLADLAKIAKHQSYLLKFVEEASSPLLFISSSDRIKRVLLSRFKTIVKVPELIRNSKDSISLIREKILDKGGPEDEDGEATSSLDIRDIVRYAPSAFPLLDIIEHSNLPSKEKIRRLLV